MSVTSSFTRIHNKMWPILYVRGSKLPKTAKNSKFWYFLKILVVQNALTGGKFVKKWLQVIQFDVLGYLFHHKKIFQFWQFYIKKSKCKISFCRRFENANYPPPPARLFYTSPSPPNPWATRMPSFALKKKKNKIRNNDHKQHKKNKFRH